MQERTANVPLSYLIEKSRQVDKATVAVIGFYNILNSAAYPENYPDDWPDIIRGVNRVAEIKGRIRQRTLPILADFQAQLREQAEARKELVVFENIQIEENRAILPDGRVIKALSARLLGRLSAQPALYPLAIEEISVALYKACNTETIAWSKGTINYLRQVLRPYGLVLSSQASGYFVDKDAEDKPWSRPTIRIRSNLIKYSNRETLRQLLTYHQQIFPNKPVNLAELARQLGITRARAGQLYSQISQEQPLPKNLRSFAQTMPTQLALQIHHLHNQDLAAPQIATQLDAPYITIRKILSQERSRERKMLIQRVKLLRNQGLGNTAIADRLGISVDKVTNVLANLLEKGEVSRLRNKRSREDLKSSRQQVKKLREAGLTNREIADRLGLSIYTVTNDIHTLIQSRDIIKPRPATNEVEAEIEQKVLELRKYGLNNLEITDRLGVKYNQVRNIASRLIRTSQIKPLPKGRRKKPI